MYRRAEPASVQKKILKRILIVSLVFFKNVFNECYEKRIQAEMY
jgi:hypothetical protein